MISTGAAVRLEARTAFVTGAGGSIGSAIALRLACHGADIVVADVVPEAAEQTADLVRRSTGRQVHVVSGDIRSEASVSGMFKDAIEVFGAVDILINNAGVNRTSGDGADRLDQAVPQITEMSLQAWHDMVDVHLDGAFLCSREMVRAKLAGKLGGSIVCISSVSGLNGMGALHYATAKAGLLGFVRSLARSCGPSGIRVNAVCPGAIESPMLRAVQSSVAIDSMATEFPLRRIGTPVDVADACLYLASEESSYLTGQVISPSGGMWM